MRAFARALQRQSYGARSLSLRNSRILARSFASVSDLKDTNGLVVIDHHYEYVPPSWPIVECVILVILSLTADNHTVHLLLAQVERVSVPP
jgi:hypothetical protein